MSEEIPTSTTKEVLLPPVKENEVLEEQNSKQEEVLKETSSMSASDLAPSVCESTFANSSTTDQDEDEDDADYFADVGFMFGREDQLPTKRETFKWKLPGGKNVTVAMHVAVDKDDKSGHSLWPAGRLLAEYLVESTYGDNVRTVVELGAGCALASLAALQVWQETLQCVVVTDSDTGVLVRACDNLETTTQHIVDSVEVRSDDGELNMAINSIVSIPIQFEALEWGNSAAIRRVQDTIEEHTEPASLTEYEDNLPPSMSSIASMHHSVTGTTGVDVVLGSDLILEDCSVVEPLLKTAAELMETSGRFLLAQSVVFSPAIENELERVCRELSLQRTVLLECDEGSKRILQFVAETVVEA